MDLADPADPRLSAIAVCAKFNGIDPWVVESRLARFEECERWIFDLANHTKVRAFFCRSISVGTGSDVSTTSPCWRRIIMKRLAFAICSVLFFLACMHNGALAQSTINAASCSQSAVQAAINASADGDTVNIPSGACTWTSGVTVNNMGITIAGSGTPNSGASTTGASSSCSATTIVVSSGITAFRLTPSYGNSTSRLSCMVISAGSGAGIGASILGSCSAGGCPNLRMDNLTFSNWAGHAEVGISYGINAVGDMFGVIDHNTVNGVSGNYIQLVEQSNASYLGVGYYGDNSWAQPENYGSANFLFIENNTFNDAGATENEGSAGGLQNQGGGRIVARFNTFNITDNFNFSLGWHGSESSGRPRSTRAYEYYQNAWSCTSTSNGCPPVIDARGGTGLMWGNSFSASSGSYFSTGLEMVTYRTQGSPSPSWGPCDGSTAYDTNDGTTYYSGTITSVSGSTITVSGNPGWSTNQWFVNGAPYSVHDVTKGSGAEIASNTGNTVSMNIAGGPGAYSPSSGDSIQILRARVCIDQAGGRGAGIMYNSSDNPANLAPANEIVSSTYLWMNSSSPAPSALAYTDTARVMQNRDFYLENANQSVQSSASAPFNGASGMGHGVLANRPSTCTAGVGYWATDQGSWNQSSTGGQGQLFVCTTTNTWTLSYTPYTYPHPLTGTGTGSTLAPPTGLQAVAH
jgi:hypothetical protein